MMNKQNETRPTESGHTVRKMKCTPSMSLEYRTLSLV